MMPFFSARTLGVFCALGVFSPLAAQAGLLKAAELRGLSVENKKDLIALVNADPDEGSRAARRKTVRRLLATADARQPLAALIDRKLAALERRYAGVLDQPIRTVYRQRLQALSVEDLRTVARTRRLWRNYLEKTSTQKHFQKQFLGPAVAVKKLLLPDATKIRSKTATALLQGMVEFNGYRDEVRAALELGDDPTTGVKASTGIPLPPLSQVRNHEQHLDHLHRTIALASSVAPLDACGVLLENANKARFIDFEEAEFVLAANEVRMLMGTVAWATDIAACAATRDHSKDRADGKAKGHWSSLPGKRGFTDRLKRFGTNGTSEGAGGGANGRGYLWGLSYGGGHTGPLYNWRRNVVGVGRYGNTYTSTYAKYGGAIHSCALFESELFLPPGIAQSHILDAGLAAVCTEMKLANFGRALELLGDVKPKAAMDKFLARYLRIALQVESDWRLECMARIEAVGDLHGVAQRITELRAAFGERADKRVVAFEKRLRTKAAKKVLAAGRAYADACAAKDRGRIGAVVTDHAGTVYAKAAKAHLAAKGKKAHPLAFFLTIDVELNRFEYLTR